MNDAAPIPYWMAFLVGPVLLAFAVWVVPGRLRDARRQLPVGRISSASPSEAADAWFPAIWAVGVGTFGAVFVLGGLARLMGID